MFGDHTPPVVRLQRGGDAVATDRGEQPFGEFDEDLEPGGLRHGLVERGVQWGDLGQATGEQVFTHGHLEPVEAVQRGGVDEGCGEPGGERFDLLPGQVDTAQLVRADPGDGGAGVLLLDDQPVRLQPQHGFPDRDLADAEGAGQRVHAQPLARLQGAVEDLGADVLVHQIGLARHRRQGSRHTARIYGFARVSRRCRRSLALRSYIAYSSWDSTERW
ncbi:hypothetical protein GCM10009635_02050 [Actinocatenispora thailandica]